MGDRWRPYRRTNIIVGTVNARYLRNGTTQIHQINRKFFAHTPAQNGGKIVSKNLKGWPGETHQKMK